MNIACVGDSITNAQHLSRDKGWTSLLAADHGWTVANHGVNGDTTRLALERVPAILAAQPDTLILQFGLNDCNRWRTDRGLPRVSLPAFAANVRELVDRAIAYDVEQIVLVALTPCLSPTLLDPHLYDRAIENVAAETLTTLFRPTALTVDHLLPDGVHLNEHGHRVFADQLGDLLCRT